MLEIKNLTKRYGDSATNAVEDLSVTLKPGEIFGFLGPNGAGKSTTIKSLVGIYPFQEGDILVDGVSIKTDPLAAKRMIGYVSDNHAVFERLTGCEYVNHIANLYGVAPEDAKARTEPLLDAFKLRAAFHRPIKSYSHGMKQKISVIAALVHNPKLWVLDEPLTGLDPQSTYQLKKVMRQHAEAGNTVFFSTHILDVVENLCDRCCIIKEGKLQGVYDLAELKASGESLEEIFVSVIGEEDQ
ncbi:MAG: ABC transporter ATP-binding protein [Ruminococcaceae bacterium]|nr:ABC transporter ATP-binding protein [Oscillospiraceae bacterium]